MIIIETERLTLRRFTLHDSPFVMQLLNDPDWIRNIGDKGVRNEDDARAHMQKTYLAMYERTGYGPYLVETKAGNVPIGMCGLLKRESLDFADIGFAFLHEHRGHGYGLEAAEASLRYGQEILRLPRVVGITLPANTATIRLMEKIGLTFEKTFFMPNDAEELALYAIDFVQVPSV